VVTGLYDRKLLAGVLNHIHSFRMSCSLLTHVLQAVYIILVRLTDELMTKFAISCSCSKARDESTPK